MNETFLFSRRAVLATAGFGLASVVTPAMAQRNAGSNGMSGATGGLYLPDTAGRGPLTEQGVRDRAVAMPIHAPAYGKPPTGFSTGRR